MKEELRALVGDAAKRFAEKRPWTRLKPAEYVGVRDAETGERGWACVMGAESEHGLAIYLGDGGRSVIDRQNRRELTVEESDRITDLIALTLIDPAEAPRMREAMLLEERIDVDGKSLVPMIFRVEPGAGTRPLRDREASFLARALCGIATAIEHGLEPRDVVDERGARLILHLSGDVAQLAVESQREDAGAAMAAHLEHELHARGRTKRLLVGLAGARLTIFEPKEGVVLDEQLEKHDIETAARRVLEALVGRVPTRRPGRVPRELWADPPELAAILAAALARVGVKVVPKSPLAELDKARARPS